MKRMVVGMAWLLAVAGCSGGADEGGSGEPTPTPGNVTFSQVQTVLDQHCVTCHYGNDLDLGGPGVRERLLQETTTCFDESLGDVVEKKVVTPGDPANSSLWHKTANVDLHCGREMPPTGQGGLIEIAPDDFTVIEAWILAGAPE